MNGAQSLVQTLLAGNVDVCFTNPGTSEMHFVAALDEATQMRCVLCLFEGVATGAADGYSRMAGKPAATLLHLGPGLANGLANIHNAKKAGTSMVNIVGEHASYHVQHNAPLTADIEGTARPYSHWVKTTTSAQTVAANGVEAIAAANTNGGQIATLILPGDAAWEAVGITGTGTVSPTPTDGISSVSVSTTPDTTTIESVASVLLSGESSLLLLTGSALSQQGQLAAARIAKRTDCELLTAVSNSRLERGVGCVALERIPYPVDEARERLARFKQIILVGAVEPVGFFAYPDKPSLLAPDNCEFHVLARHYEDGEKALIALAERLDANELPDDMLETYNPPPLPTGQLRGSTIAQSVAAQLPDHAIVSDESVSLGRGFFSLMRNTSRHSWLQIMGGAIGLGMPMATGAAIACPDRHVISLQADGSAMYTVQALWTQARERLNITTIILANREYAILKGEMKNVGVAELGPKATSMLELNRPTLDWVSIAEGLGVEASQADTAEAFNEQLAKALSNEGPHLIEALV